MDLSSATLLLFGIVSALRIVSYIPQIRQVALDSNGASAISYFTWGLWAFANLATALYAAVNLKDSYLCVVSIGYALCCCIVIGLTFVKRQNFCRPCSSRRQLPIARKTVHQHPQWT